MTTIFEAFANFLNNIPSGIAVIFSAIALLIAWQERRTLQKAHDLGTEWKMREKAQSFSVSQDLHRREAREILENAYAKLRTPKPDDSEKPYSLQEILSRFRPEADTPEEFLAEPWKTLGEDKVRQALDLIFGNYENLALAVEAKIADPKTAYQLLGKTLIYYFYIFQEYVYFKHENKLRRFSYLIPLAQKWMRKPENSKFEKTKFVSRSSYQSLDRSR